MSSLKAVLPSGAIVSVSKVTPIMEQIIRFNGTKRRFSGIVEDMRYDANGVLLHVITNSEEYKEYSDDVVIGNLRKDQVQEIIKEIMESGYYNFSQFSYQNIKKITDIRFEKEYLPYHNESWGGFCSFSNWNERCNEFRFTGFCDDDFTESSIVSTYY